MRDAPELLPPQTPVLVEVMRHDGTFGLVPAIYEASAAPAAVSLPKPAPRKRVRDDNFLH